jgi:hypothetical protein
VLKYAALLFPIISYAGGGQFEAPVVQGRCNPIVLPEDMDGEGWKWIKVHERNKIASGDNEIHYFQTMYCREFNSAGGLIREYVIPVEFWRPRLRKPNKKIVTGGH